MNATSGVALDTSAGNFTQATNLSGTRALTKLGANTLTLTGTNSYTGSTTVEKGVLNIQNGAALGTSDGSTIIRLGAELQIQGGITVEEKLVHLSGTGISNAGALRNMSGNNTLTGTINLVTYATRINSDADTLTLSGVINSAHDLTFGGAGNTICSGVIQTGFSTLTKDGAGTLTLSGANTYTGTTTVSAGKLTIASNGTINTTSSVSIGAGEFNYNSTTVLTRNITFTGTGGTLSGTGTIGTAVTVTSGNSHAPGAVGTAGSQAFSDSLTYGTGSIFEWDLTSASNSSGFDQVIGSSGKNFAAASAAFHVITDLDFSNGTFWENQKQWSSIFTGFGSLTGWDANTAVAVYSTAGNPRNVSSYGAFTVTGTTLTWNYSTVPEPTGALAGLLLGAGMLRRKRRRCSP